MALRAYHRVLWALFVILNLSQAPIMYVSWHALDVEDCPGSCSCEVRDDHVDITDNLLITDCHPNQTDWLVKLFHRYPKQTTLEIRYQLSKVPCSLSSLSQLLSLNLSGNLITSVPCDLSNLAQLNDLDLSLNHMESFPCELSSLTNLTWLHLRRNHIHTIPCDLSDMVNLKTLDLSSNALKSWPCELSNLWQLTTLDISDNRIETILCNLSSFSRLTSLRFAANHLSIFPCQLLSLPNITNLDLSENTLESVPCELSAFSKLKVLDLSRNRLKALPHKVFTMTMLTSLKCSGNNLSAFPCELSKLMKLTHLDISRNGMESVQCNLSNLTQLISLNLCFNALYTVPCDLAALPQITTLLLAWNKIESVTCALSSLTQLSALDLANNDISSIPDLSNFTKLNFLDLRSNSISVLDSWPISLARVGGALQKIHLGNNQVSQFTHKETPATSCNTIRKGVIYLGNNNISHFMDIAKGWNLNVSTPEELYHCLDFLLNQRRGNSYSCDCVDYEVYKLIQQRYRNASRYRLQCHSPIKLRGHDPSKISLDHFVCDSYSNCPLGCNCTKSPYHKTVIINCKQWEGTSLPKTIPELLTEDYPIKIFFDDGNLTQLSDTLYLKKVVQANFSNNYISMISMEALLDFQNVSLLHLDNNKLQKLPRNISVVKLRRISSLQLGNNPWVCDCAAIKTRDWMKAYERSIKDPYNIKCQYPSHMVNKSMMYTDDSLFCPKGENKELSYIITLLVFGTLVGLICISYFIILRMRKRQINKQKQHQMALLDGQDMAFDVFMSYATEDEDYILNELIPELENHNFKVCLHRIHFLGGNTIIDNISECINNSRRSLVYFSNFYKDSRFCVYEFKEALNKDVREGTTRLITIKDTDLDMEGFDDSTRAYFEKRTYIEKESQHFWENLFHSLPKKRANEVIEIQEDAL